MDTAEAVKRHAARIFARAVSTKTMPLGNQTGMTDDERAQLGAWYGHGAREGAYDAKLAPVAATEKAEVFATPKDEAAALFKARCVTCHGAAGKGDGPAAAGLPIKPRNFSDSAWQAAMTDGQLAKTIQEGGAAVGKSATMPANPDLAGKPLVTAALVAIVRAFGKP